LKDEDFTVVEYKKFGNDGKGIYPSFTYCFKWPILYGKIWDKFGNEDTYAARTKTRKEYLNYVLGKKFEDDKFGESDYDQLSYKLEDFLLTIEAGLVNGGVVQWSIRNGKLKLNRAFRKFTNDVFEIITQDFNSEEIEGIPIPFYYISHRGIQQKCYTFDIPSIRNEQINRFKLIIKAELLPGYKKKKTIKPILHQANDDFSVVFHYPNQRFKSLSTASGFTSSIESSKHYLRKYFLANIEVLRRRNKPSKPCVDGKYDEEIIRQTMDSIGCKPPTIKLGDNTTSACNNETTFEFQSSLINKPHHPPCESIQSISEFHGEGDGRWATGDEGKLMLEIHIQNQYYKEMVYNQAYTLESLIGNSGGYIG
jgi:hypothetical protein